MSEQTAKPLRARLTDSRVMWLSALLVLILAAWGSVAAINTMLKPSGCERPATLQVAAAPAIAPALGEVARNVDGGACYQIEVVSRDSGAFAESLANPPGTLPYAWVPESTFWLKRARSLGAFEVPDRGTSVASSPVVLAMTEQVALQLGWPDGPVQWPALLGASVPIGLPDPATDPLGISAVIGVRSVTGGQRDPGAANVAMLRRLATNTVPRAADLFQRLPEAGRGPATLNAFVSSEQAVLRYNSRQRTQLVAGYPDRSVPTLDFPFVVLPGAPQTERDAAARFLQELLGDVGRKVLGQHEFRTPDGVLGPSASPAPNPTAARQRAEPFPPVPLPDEDALVQLLNTWTGIHLSARLLGVIDISGSMNERGRNGGETRLAATMKAAQEGLGLLMDTTDVGLWLFSTKLEGNRDYRVLAPVRPLSENRLTLYNQLAAVRAKPDGDTGLYDTALAAYQEARRNWIPGRINLVLITTDGRNDDDDSITRQQLLAELTKLNDPRRPLPILFIGVGSGIDAGELNAIANATGGKVYLTQEPSGIRQIFFSALSDLSCQPPACKR